MKYRLQRQRKVLKNSQWAGVETIDLASDLEAFEFLLEQCRRTERVSAEPSTAKFRIVDADDVVVATFSPNPSKLIKETAR